MLPLARFEQRYAIREDGTIVNLANNQPLVPTVNENGYLKVGLATGDGGHKQCLVHILVAKHFIPNPYDHPQVNHRDGIKAHCWKDNLEWVSAQENVLHAFQYGLRPGYMPADDKERYLEQVLQGAQVNDIAAEIGRRPETLHKMLRETAKRLGIHGRWEAVMKENRRNVAIRQLAEINRRGA
jgi:hypothetical protein